MIKILFDKGIKKLSNTANTSFTLSSFDNWPKDMIFERPQTKAMKLSAVNACVEILSNSMSKLPYYCFDSNTKEKVHHPIIDLLECRPNELMTPSVFKKYMHCQKLLWGNANAVIFRDKWGNPVELLPLPPGSTKPHIDIDGRLWFIYVNPKTGQMHKFFPCEIIHITGYTEDGINGISVLERASQIINTASEAQKYENKLYSQNARPSGILKTAESHMDKNAKDKIREEWANIHGGADNAFRIAVLDLGLEYQQISVSNKDAQFVESKALSVEDISRFFNMPIYKINAGKQSYSSNEQNAIEYVVNTLHPECCQYEQEYTYKSLFQREIDKGLEIKINLMAELKGDFDTRGKWYTYMRNLGAFSVDDILALEDRPNVPGGDVRLASLNYVPLEDFKELSKERNKKGWLIKK